VTHLVERDGLPSISRTGQIRTLQCNLVSVSKIAQANCSSDPSITFGPVGDPCPAQGFTNFADRSAIIDSLVDGTLVVDVHMKPHEPIKARYHNLFQKIRRHAKSFHSCSTTRNLPTLCLRWVSTNRRTMQQRWQRLRPSRFMLIVQF
jgi:hypothetical protein